MISKSTTVPIVCLIAALACSPAAWSMAEPEEKPPQPVIRTYNVADLVRPPVRPAYRSDVLPPTRLRSAGRGAPAIPGGTAFMPGRVHVEAAGRPESPQERMEGLIDLIRELADPPSWRGMPREEFLRPGDERPERAFPVAAIRSFGDLLIISQTPGNHEKIKALLAQIRQEQAPAQLVCVRARWVVMDSEQLEKVVEGASVPQQVDPAAMEKVKPTVAYEGQATCFAGQCLTIASGRGQTVVTDLEAETTENAVAIEPMAKLVHWGAILEITPTLSPKGETVELDVHSIVSEPAPAARALARPEARGEVIAGQQKGIDRLDFSLHDLRTALTAPLNKPVIVGGMTMQGAEKGKVLYLIVEVTASKPKR